MENFIFCALFDIIWYDEAAKNFLKKNFFSLNLKFVSFSD